MSIQPGERIPEAVLQYIHDGVQKVDTITLFDGNKTVLFAVPGAFTPTCSERHLPGFVEHFDEFKRRGINVACMAMNDPFVMEAWGESQHVPEGLRMLSDGNGELTDVTVLGYEDQRLGAPSELSDGRYPESSGEAVGSSNDADAGFGLGDTIVVQPGGFEITIVGLADDVQLNAGPTLFVAYADYVAAVKAVNPDAGEPLPNVLAVAPADGVTGDEVVANINARSTDLDALTKGDAADETPGVAQVRQSFQVIFLLYGLVIPCVTGLFFLIITFQKSGALTLLRAIGAPAKRLVGSLLVQAVIIVTVGYAIGLALYTPLSQRRLGGIQLRFETTAVVVWAVLLLVLGIGSSLIAARRVLKIDPIEATTGGANR